MILRGIAAEIVAGRWRGGFGWFCGGWSLSVAAFGRVLRTLGGKNIGKCRLRAHQHPLSPPLSNLRRTRPCKHPKQDASSTRDGRVLGDVLGCGLKMGCFLHRFVISGPNLGITACFTAEMPQAMQ